MVNEVRYNCVWVWAGAHITPGLSETVREQVGQKSTKSRPERDEDSSAVPESTLVFSIRGRVGKYEQHYEYCRMHYALKA